jgi:hypothetical protein
MTGARVTLPPLPQSVNRFDPAIAFKKDKAMMWNASALNGLPIKATAGGLGLVSSPYVAARTVDRALDEKYHSHYGFRLARL